MAPPWRGALEGSVLGSIWTHHSLVVDLYHLVARVDLLTLVGWRLQRQRETRRQEKQRPRSESHWRAWSSLLDYCTDPTQETTRSALESGGENTEWGLLQGSVRFLTARLGAVPICPKNSHLHAGSQRGKCTTQPTQQVAKLETRLLHHERRFRNFPNFCLRGAFKEKLIGTPNYPKTD